VREVWEVDEDGFWDGVSVDAEVLFEPLQGGVAQGVEMRWVVLVALVLGGCSEPPARVACDPWRSAQQLDVDVHNARCGVLR
jgi:hypothetical protein